MKIIKVKPGDFIVAGQQGEELARRVEFDITEWERLYGYGVVQLLVHRMGDEDFYPVAIEQAAGVVGWVVTVPENSVEGRYHTYELRYYAGETLAKSAIGQYSVQRSFVGTEAEPPEAHEGWVDQIIATGAESLAAQIAAEAARDGAIEAQLNANLANTEAQTAKQEVSSQVKRAETAANSAEVSEKNAKSSEVAAVKAAEEAENSERNAIVAARQAELSKDGIVQAETNASQYAAAAAKSAADASASASSAQTFMAGAETARGQAQTFAQAASNFFGRAEESEEAAKQSEVNAAKSAQEAKEAAANAKGVADWNAAEGETGHILNRTHYEEHSVVEILPECRAVPTDDDGSAFAVYENIPVLAVGETYIVNYNGAEYTCVCQDMSAMQAGAVLLGNGEMMGLSGNGEPFLMFVAEESGNMALVIMPLDGSTSVTISIRQEQTTIVPLPTKYLPEGVPYVGETVVMVEILPECTPVYSDGMFILTENIPSFVIGETYSVKWNGTEYECVAQDAEVLSDGDMTGPFFGNQSAFGATDTGEPFAIIINNGILIMYPVDGTTELTISIKQEGTVTKVNKLDSRCLPDTVATKADIFGAMEASY